MEEKKEGKTRVIRRKTGSQERGGKEETNRLPLTRQHHLASTMTNQHRIEQRRGFDLRNNHDRFHEKRERRESTPIKAMDRNTTG
jgi:hypothetical protein